MALPSQVSCANCCCFNPVEPLDRFHWLRLESQLRENQLPSDIEIQTIVRLERDIEGYDLEISRLQSRLFSLQYKRSLVADYVSRHKSLLAPIRQLPNDVLIEIFSFSSFSTTVSRDSSEVDLPQLNLSQVCGHWRSIVNASPMLWSRLNLMLDDPPPTFSDAAMVNVVEMLLTKSMDRSLTIDILSLDGESIHPALQLLSNHSNRWMDATLQCNTLILRHAFSVSGGFPRLRHLDIMDSTTIAVPLAQYPDLRSLSLSMAGTHYDDFPVGRQVFPWGQLKEVELYMPTISQLIDVLSWCAQLRSLSLYDWAETGVSDNPIASPTVVSVSLRKVNRDGKKELFRLAKFPQLHTLEISACGLPSDCAYPFIAHSPLITNLFLTDIHYRHFGDILKLFRLLPRIINFRWSQEFSYMPTPGTVYDFFSELRPHPSASKTLFPRLKHFNLKITDYRLLDFNPALPVFIEMVQARWTEVEHPNDRLTSVRLSFPKSCLDHDLIRHLAYLPKAGMAISIEDKCGFIL